MNGMIKDNTGEKALETVEQIDAAGNEAAFVTLFGKKATISASFKSYRVDRNKTRYDSK
jgi:hypothetical protein